MTTVVLADDQRVIREGLVSLLGLLPDIEVLGTAADGEEALALVERLRPDIVLMDLRMPRCDGVTATRRLRELNHLFTKTGVRDRAQAVAYAFRHELVG